MDQILAPCRGLTFDFEFFLETELGLYCGDRKKPVLELCRYGQKERCRLPNCTLRHEKAPKTVMCKHWLRGLCKKGEKCEFLHEFNMKKMPECWFYSNYGECSNAECMYLHIDPESKIKECLWFNRGFCKHGPGCRNKHVRKLPCQAFLTGFCPLGPACESGHPKFELPKLDDRTAFKVLNHDLQ